MPSNGRILGAAALAALLALGGTAGLAQTQGHGDHGGHNAAPEDTHGHDGGESGHGAHGAHGATPDDLPASTRAYMEANERMHGAMDIAFTGDADVDFARGMIPHHEGAIAMAEVVLEHGQDPALRALAEEIIATQQAEIDFLRAWLADHGH